MAKLVIEAEGASRIYEILEDRLTVGRHPENEVRLRSETAADKHLLLTRQEETYRVVALSPEANFRVNGTDASERNLRHGDRIEVGDVTLLFLDEDEVPEGTDPSATEATAVSAPQPEAPAIPKRSHRSAPRTPRPAKKGGRPAAPAPSEPGPAGAPGPKSLSDVADSASAGLALKVGQDRPRRRERRPPPRRSARSWAMMSAILTLSATAIILLINIATSDSLGKGPDHLVNIAEVQATRGNFQNALNFLDLANKKSPGPQTQSRIDKLRNKINSMIQRRGDEHLLSSAGARRRHLEKFVKVFLTKDPDSRPACRVLVQLAGKWLEQFRSVCSKYPEHAEDITAVETLRRRYTASARLEEPDTVDDVLFSAKRSVRRDHRRYVEAVSLLDAYLGRPSPERSAEVREYRDRLVKEGEVWLRQYLHKVDRMIRAEAWKDAREEIDFLRDQGLPAWQDDITAAEQRLQTAQSRQ